MSSCQTTLTAATAHCWILKDEGAPNQNSGWINSYGHIAALYQDELYEILTSKAGNGRLQQFGVLHGMRRIVIYVEPDGKVLTSNTSRTHLLINREPLPWADWAQEFRTNMPGEIEEFMRTFTEGPAETDRSKSIAQRLERIRNLFEITRYRPYAQGKLQLSSNHSTFGGIPNHDSETRNPFRATNPRRLNGAGLSGGDVYDLFSSGKTTPGQEESPDPFRFPKVHWISVYDDTRDKEDLADRAARYIREQNVLLINADFRVFTDMEKSWVKKTRWRRSAQSGSTRQRDCA